MPSFGLGPLLSVLSSFPSPVTSVSSLFLFTPGLSHTVPLYLFLTSSSRPQLPTTLVYNLPPPPSTSPESLALILTDPSGFSPRSSVSCDGLGALPPPLGVETKSGRPEPEPGRDPEVAEPVSGKAPRQWQTKTVWGREVRWTGQDRRPDSVLA